MLAATGDRRALPSVAPLGPDLPDTQPNNSVIIMAKRRRDVGLL